MLLLDNFLRKPLLFHAKYFGGLDFSLQTLVFSTHFVSLLLQSTKRVVSLNIRCLWHPCETAFQSCSQFLEFIRWRHVWKDTSLLCFHEKRQSSGIVAATNSFLVCGPPFKQFQFSPRTAKCKDLVVSLVANCSQKVGQSILYRLWHEILILAIEQDCPIRNAILWLEKIELGVANCRL